MFDPRLAHPIGVAQSNPRPGPACPIVGRRRLAVSRHSSPPRWVLPVPKEDSCSQPWGERTTGGRARGRPGRKFGFVLRPTSLWVRVYHFFSKSLAVKAGGLNTPNFGTSCSWNTSVAVRGAYGVEVFPGKKLKLSSEERAVPRVAAVDSPHSPLPSSSSPCTATLSRTACRWVRRHACHRLVATPFFLLPGRARACDAASLPSPSHSPGRLWLHLRGCR